MFLSSAMHDLGAIFKQFLTYRRLFVAFVIPFGLFWSVFNFSGQVMEMQMNALNNTKFPVALIANNNAAGLKQKLGLHRNVQLVESYTQPEAEQLLKADSLAAIVVVPANFDSLQAKDTTAEISVLYYSDKNSQAFGIVADIVEAYEDDLLLEKKNRLNISSGILNPLTLDKQDQTGFGAQMQMLTRMIQKSIGLMIAFLILLFAFFTSKHASIHLFVKMKEISPAGISGQAFSARQTAVSKLAALGAFLALAGLWVSLKFSYHGVGQTLVQTISNNLSAWGLLQLLGVLGIVAIFAASVWGMFTAVSKDPYYCSQRMNYIYFAMALLFMAGAASEEKMAYVPLANVAWMCTEILRSELTLSAFLQFAGLMLGGALLLHLLAYQFFKMATRQTAAN